MNPKPNCSTPNCNRPAKTRGMCGSHYQSWAYRNLPGFKEAKQAYNKRYQAKVKRALSKQMVGAKPKYIDIPLTTQGNLITVSPQRPTINTTSLHEFTVTFTVRAPPAADARDIIEENLGRLMAVRSAVVTHARA